MSQVKKFTFNPEDVVQRDWRFGIHLPVGPNGEDLHLVKEILTLKDKTQIPNMRVIPDYERPVWMTKLPYRTYTDKKEYERASKLEMHMCTQSMLRNKVAMLTGNGTSNMQLSELLGSSGGQFVYGADIPSTTIIHRELYQKPNEGKNPVAYRYAAFDTETDVVHGTEQIIIGSMTMLPEVHLVIRKDWLDYNGYDVESRIMGVLKDKIDPIVNDFFKDLDAKGKGSDYPAEIRELKYTYEIVDNELNIVEKSFQWFHDRRPDWMGIWNIDFDVTKILNCCKRFNVEPSEVLCDPGIPHDFRIARYKRAQTMKIAASGKGKPVSPHDQWNFMFLTASFTMIDAMSVYRLLRLGDQEERSYSLDSILDKELGGMIRKLNHPPADIYVKEKWHQVMQVHHKFIYLAYAAMDTIAMCLLDRKTRDLSHRLPAMADISGFDQANSQPKRLRDSFYVFAKDDHDCIIGSVGYTRDKKPEPEPDYGDEIENGFGGDDGEDDEEETFEVLNRRDWV